jgi:uncharacterized BrkB/YihY/UPF0761 family membrane protein
LILASVGISASFTGLRRLGEETTIPVISNDAFWRWGVNLFFPWALSFVTFLALYRYLPNTKVWWPYLAFGAVVGSVGFEGTKHVFVWYVQSHSTYTLVYGSLGTLVAFLTWAYLSAFMLLVGGEVASVLPKVLGPDRVSLPEERAFLALQDWYHWERERKASRAREGSALVDLPGEKEPAGAEVSVLVAAPPRNPPPTVKQIIATLFREWVTEAAERSPRPG